MMLTLDEMCAYFEGTLVKLMPDRNWFWDGPVFAENGSSRAYFLFNRKARVGITLSEIEALHNVEAEQVAALFEAKIYNAERTLEAA